MITVNLRGSYWLSDRNYYMNNAENEFLPEFEIPLEDGNVTVVLYTKDNFLALSYTFTCSHQEFKNSREQLIQKKKMAMETAGRKVLVAIKYGLNLPFFSDQLEPYGASHLEWTTDDITWYHVGNGPMLYRFLTQKYLNGNEKIVKNYLENSFEPFIALKHLHRAKSDDDPRFKWIDATIAAELAIKEFFVRKNPLLKAILLEVPSPPLRKLYKKLLIEYTGEESPLPAKFFDEASRIRNELVHRPQEVTVTIEEAEEYVAGVEKAIYHLLSMLYPEDKSIQSIYKSTLRPTIMFNL